MKILHTSDWHLGCSLFGHKRYEEYERFLSWLCDLIRDENIDVFLVAGDIFDTGTPSNRAQELYYGFLNRVAAVPGLQVVITAGNHDSPSLINAPQDLLKQLNIHVFGSIPEDPADEVLVIKDAAGKPTLVVCAVPYLRDRDIRLSEPGESIEDKTRKLQEGIVEHYRTVAGIAAQKRGEPDANIPIIATGHLFVSGGKTVDGDGVRELYVGNLARIRAEDLKAGVDYLALGHLHVPQVVGNDPAVRYCGSPIALGFGDAGDKKSVVIVEFSGAGTSIREVTVPQFRDIRTLTGNIVEIEHKIGSLLCLSQPVWIEAVVSGPLSGTTLQARLRELTDGTKVTLIRTRTAQVGDGGIEPEVEGESLEDLSTTDVFRRCMAVGNIPGDQQEELMAAFSEVLHEKNEEDTLAE
ncbi:MAG: exonuclease SbcCD subunit D C-terminal domain-containing protein [Methanoregula sp.]